MNKPSLSIFFPCYNEAKNIPELLEGCSEFVNNYGGDVEVIIINDGSKDNTIAVVRALQGRYPFVKLVNHARNRGYGAAVHTGFISSTKDLIFYTDSDLQFRLDRLGAFIEALRTGYDVVIGYRIHRQDSPIRKFNAWAWGRLVSFLFQFKVRDIDCAYKLFTRRSVEQLNLQATGALVSTELLVKMAKSGFRWTELPVEHYRRKAGKQTGASPIVVAKAFIELMKLYRRLKHYRGEGSPEQRVARERMHFDEEATREPVFPGHREFDYLSHPCLPENNHLLTLLPEKMEGLRVLDLGCGVAEAALCFAQRGAIVSAVDVSEKAIEVAQQLASKSGTKVDFIQVDGYQLPFPADTFDLVYGNGVLHHLDLTRSAPEIKRVLKPNGFCFFIEPTLGNPLISVYRVMAAAKRSKDEKPLGQGEFELLRQTFSQMETNPFQMATLAAFLKMALLERMNPSKHSYWRQPILYPERYASIYRWGGKLDNRIKRVLPRLAKLLCWNNAIVLRK